MADALELPPSVIARIIKQSLTDNVQCAGEVKKALAKSGGLFVLYVTSR